MPLAETEKPLLLLQGILLYCVLYFYESHWWTILLFASVVIGIEVIESKRFDVWFKRWQLHPIHLIALIEFNQTLLLQQREIVMLPYIYILLLLVSIIATILVPINTLPAPTGPYLVGTVTKQFEVEEEKRQNMFDQNSTIAKRMVTIKIWYPAECPTKLAPLHVLHNIYSDDIRNHWGYGKLDENIPFLTAPSFYLTRCHSHISPPIKEISQKFRMVIYEHGQGSLPEKNTSLIEDLTSHGYIVCSFYHNDWDKSWPGPAQRRVLEIKHMMKYMQSVFGGKIDMESGVVVMGHSFGGSTVVSLCTNGNLLKEFNILGGVAMDPWLEIFPLETMSKVDRRLMMVNSDLWLSKKSDKEKIEKLKKSSNIYVCTVKGTAHYNFGDTFYTIESIFGNALLPFLEEENSSMRLFGPANQRKMHTEIKKLIRSYVDSLINEETMQFTKKWKDVAIENEVETPYFNMSICI